MFRDAGVQRVYALVGRHFLAGFLRAARSRAGAAASGGGGRAGFGRAGSERGLPQVGRCGRDGEAGVEAAAFGVGGAGGGFARAVLEVDG